MRHRVVIEYSHGEQFSTLRIMNEELGKVVYNVTFPTYSKAWAEQAENIGKTAIRLMLDSPTERY